MRATSHRFLLAGAVICASAIGASPAGADPGFRADPHEVVWDFVPVGTTSEPRTVALLNPGTSATTFGSLSIAGSARTDFALVEDNCSGRTIPSGGGCEIKVVFKPTREGTRLATVRVPDGTACANWVTLAGSGAQASAPPRAHASVCSAPAREVPAEVAPPSGTQPTIKDNSIIEGSSKSCTSRRRFRIRLSPPRGTTIEKARVMLAGKKVKTEKVGGRTTAVIDLRGRKKRTAVVEIKIWASNGRQYEGRRTYRTCAQKEAGGSPRY